ncbi:MAG: EscU/YscU/HrcU family type III secretion system export apparatus switch protein [Bryobacteraceae bacterium]|nr:EscU/YscU/HrcU family type III secretion system export apparatus switch protein [Bryobacteraceae bacterium]
MSDNRTEQPTQQKLHKAREKGQFPAAKELVGALQFFIVVLIVSRAMPGWWELSQQGMREVLLASFRRDWTQVDLIHHARRLVMGAFLPLGAAAGIVAGLTLLLQLGTTNFGIHLGALSPNFNRLNPLNRLKEIPKQNFPHAIQALLLLMVLLWIIWAVAREQLPMLLMLPLSPVRTGIVQIAAAASGVLWKSTMILLLFGVVEGMRQRLLYTDQLKMSKQEIRDEHKESEGDPQIKGRIRRLRRDLLRRRMMQDVPTATAVIVNPTHYAVAIRYDPASMSAPKLVAKGRNYLAARIREVARENGVTIVENPPLARALYGSVDVGRDIPPDFYRAVAEVLAYVYRITGNRSIAG